MQDMKKRKLGQSLAVAPIGLGCMGMSEFYGPADRETSLATLGRAVDLGIDLFDTADMYGSGANEELLGEFLKQSKADIRIATKFGLVRDAFDYAPTDHAGVSNHPDYARLACEASLKRLGVEYIDLYYVHRIEPGRPIEEVMETLADLVQEGKIGAIGLSEVSPDTLRRAHKVHPVAAVQSEYSLWSRDPEEAILDTCEELGVGFVAYSPLGRGFLTGALSLDDLAADDWRRSNPRFEEAAIEQNRRIGEVVNGMAQNKGCTPAQILLAWVLSKRPFIVPIPGTKRVSYLEDNVGAASLDLSASEVAAMEAELDELAVIGDRYAPQGMAVLDG